MSDDATSGASPSAFLGRSRRWWQWAGFIAAAALAFGLLASLQGYYQAILNDRSPDLWRSVRVWMPDYLLWALLTPFILRLGRRWPVIGEGWPSHLVRHLVAGALVTLVELQASVQIVGRIVEGLPPPNYDGFWDWYLGVIGVYGAWGLLVYFLIVAGGQAHDIYQRYRERELEAARLDARASRLEARLTEARLAALTARLQPHFLFNTLNAMSELVHADPDTAEEMIVRLGDLLRLVIQRGEEHWSTLAEEIELVRAYLTLERARYGSRLRTGGDLPDDVLDIRLPSLTLQPLVENAVRHGIAPLSRPGRVELRAERRDGRLRVEVRDDGIGPDAERTEGIGLGTTRRRLRELYGEDFRLELRPAEGGGAVALLEVPVEHDGPPAGPDPGRETTDTGGSS